MEGDQKTVMDGEGQTTESTVIIRPPKTFHKTNTENDDDETFVGFISVCREVTKQVTGREPSKAETERWRELAEVLATELKIAATRTTVSSVPSFLAEHLRRRLWKVDKKQAAAEEKQEAKTTRPYFSPEQIRDCPDCGGSGMYYPQGYEKGVAKCFHERLSAKEDSTNGTT
jgi:hypothetical protein